MKRKILYILLSAVIAFGLWVYVITTVSPEWEETYEDIPVILSNESALHDRGLMLDQEKIPTVTLRLKGNRSELINLNKSNITLKVNLAGIYEIGKQPVGYSISFPGNNSIEVISQSPMEISLNIAERKTEQIPVVLTYKGSVPQGYRTDKENLVLSQEYITVTGPAKVVNQLKHAEVQVDLEGKKETIIESLSYTLWNDDGTVLDEKSAEKITVDTETVDLMLKIQRYQEVELKLNVIPGGGASSTNVDISMDLKTIAVSGPEQLLKQLGTTLEIGDLKLGEIETDGTIKYSIDLPEGLENLTGKDEVTVTVSFRDLKTNEFEVTKIDPKKVPENMDVVILTKALKVKVRGPQVLIDALTEEDITVLVDFSEAELGTDTYKCEIHINKNPANNGAGAVGSYTVSAEVTEKVEEPETKEE